MGDTNTQWFSKEDGIGSLVGREHDNLIRPWVRFPL